MIHPTAIVSPDVQVSETVHLWQGVNVMAGTQFGEFVSVGGYTEIGRYCRIGERTRIGYGCFIPNRTQIASHVFIGPRVVMCDDDHPEVNNAFYKAQPPTIGERASIGAGAVLLPGVQIGEGAVIGAGAVVTKDVPSYATWVGNPAHDLRR